MKKKTLLWCIAVIIAAMVSFPALAASEASTETAAEEIEVTAKQRPEEEAPAGERRQRGGGMPRGEGQMMPSDSMRPDSMPPGNMPPDSTPQMAFDNRGASETSWTGIIEACFTPVSSAVMLILGFLFVIFYKRKMY